MAFRLGDDLSHARGGGWVVRLGTHPLVTTRDTGNDVFCSLDSYHASTRGWGPNLNIQP